MSSISSRSVRVCLKGCPAPMFLFLLFFVVVFVRMWGIFGLFVGLGC